MPKMPQRLVSTPRSTADRLQDVLQSVGRRSFVLPPSEIPTMELVAEREMTPADEQGIRGLLDIAALELDILLRVVGGGKGCTRIIVSVECEDAVEARRLLGEIFNSGVFCRAANDVGFTYLYRNEPYVHKTLRDGSFRGALPDDGLPAFISYAHEDREHKERLERHITPLIRQKQLNLWHDAKLAAGSNWRDEIQAVLASSRLFLFLISADFFASEYCVPVELAYALERCSQGQARAVPILVSPVDFEGTPIELLQALPTGGKPVTSWVDREEAWTDVAKNIRTIVRMLRQA